MSHSDVPTPSDGSTGRRRRVRRFLDKYFESRTLMGISSNGPAALWSPPCRHESTHSSDCYHDSCSSNSRPDSRDSNSRPRQFFYLPRTSSLAEASINSVCLNRATQLFNPKDSVLLTSATPDLSMSNGGVVGVGILSQPYTGPPLSRCVGLDPTLVSSDFVKSCNFESSDQKDERPLDQRKKGCSGCRNEARWPYFVVDNTPSSSDTSNCSSSDSSKRSDRHSFCDEEVTDFALVEGLVPGVETLTHTASGIPRRTVNQNLIRIWRVTLTLICHYPEALPASGKFIEELIVNMVSMISICSRPNSLLSILKYLFRSVQVRAADGSDWYKLTEVDINRYIQII